MEATLGSIAIKEIETEEHALGKVMVNIEVVNIDDETLARIGQIKLDKVRKVTVSALVDTGSTILSLPEEVIQNLGLQIYRTAVSRFANGQKSTRNIYGPVTLNVMGRQTAVLAMAGHSGTPPLLGQIPLEGLDLMVDSKRQRLIPGHPDQPNEQVYES